MSPSYHAVQIEDADSNNLRITYQDHPVSKADGPEKGVILLLHGFPQTSHQYRHVLPRLAKAGYRCIAPDYRGAGRSGTSAQDFRKTTMANDMIALLDRLKITEPVHVVGHDIGGMIAFALASRHPERVRSVSWGECPLPGTESYRHARTEDAVTYFHFIFHSVPDLPEALVTGHEKAYISHFVNKITYNFAAFTEDDIDFYAAAYAQPGALRCAFGVYRAFETDARENQEWVQREGKCKVPTLSLSGEFSRHKKEAEEMVKEVTVEDKVEVGVVQGASHYIAEENPEGFCKAVLEWVEKN
ncbi:hypothetical protein Q7P37_008000 [Cladosporium fusiforme]